MNERIRELMGKTLDSEFSHTWDTMTYEDLLQFSDKFAQLIVEECRNVVTELYRKSPLEVCGYLITADEEIAKHFYGVEE